MSISGTYKVKKLQIEDKCMTLAEINELPDTPMGMAMKGAAEQAGSMVMLLPEDSLLLLGDACNYQVFLFDDDASSVADYKRALQHVLDAAGGRYDNTLMSHGDGWGVPDMVERVMAVCDDIMEGRSDCVPFGFKSQPGLLAKAINPDRSRADGGAGNIAYNPNKIW